MSDVISCAQALSSIDIGSLICNVGAGGGAAPAAATAAAAPAGGDAPGNDTRLFRCFNTCLILFRLSPCLLFALQPRRKRRKRRRKKSPRSLMTTWASVFSTKTVLLIKKLKLSMLFVIAGLLVWGLAFYFGTSLCFVCESED